jgi:hypothetical protein
MSREATLREAVRALGEVTQLLSRDAYLLVEVNGSWQSLACRALSRLSVQSLDLAQDLGGLLADLESGAIVLPQEP